MKIALVGEAYGEQEERQRMPFVGPAGYELNRQLEEAGIARASCLVTNVFNVRPKPTNDIANLCCGKKECGHNLPPLAQGKYIRAEYLPELERLYQELLEFSPTVIVALGGTAAWATLGNGSISRVRGAVAPGAALLGDFPLGKVLPTYHPAAVLRDYSLRPVTLLDLMKARREAEFPEIRRPEREVWIEPSLAEIELFFNEHIASARRLAIDIETAGDQITCFGVAPHPGIALVIPFVDNRKPGRNYWPDLASELMAWEWVRRICDTDIPKVGQNFQYDMAFLWRRYGIPVRRVEHDTMLLSHAAMPESPKGLSFLGSVYTNEASWKLMNRKGKTTVKRED